VTSERDYRSSKMADEVGGTCHKWDICYNELEVIINKQAELALYGKWVVLRTQSSSPLGTFNTKSHQRRDYWILGTRGNHNYSAVIVGVARMAE